jgi:DNA replication and repair protein RecF
MDSEFTPGFHLLLGDNAQGKTNVLEAIYLLATLRSFRGVGGAQMIRHDAKGYFVGATVVGQATAEIKAYWSPRERQLSLNGVPVRRLADYLGTLRAVVFCTEDLQLVKGAARGRRRFLDLLLAQTQPSYLPLLLRYTQALRSRNALLKQPTVDDDQLAGFTHELVETGGELMAARQALVPKFSPLVRLAFRRIAHDTDELKAAYAPSVKGDLAVALAQSRQRERGFRATVVGPHRGPQALPVPVAHLAAQARLKLLPAQHRQVPHAHNLPSPAPPRQCASPPLRVTAARRAHPPSDTRIASPRNGLHAPEPRHVTVL